jgi:hypothetical protein
MGSGVTRRPRSPRARRGRAAGGLALAVGLLATTATAARQPLPDELSIGEWRGHGTAIGVTQASDQGALIVITGTFGADLGFSVPNDGPTTGRWDLRGQTSWQLVFGNSSGSAFLSHQASGEMDGDRTRIGLGRSTIVSSGSASVPPAGSFPVASTDPLGPLDLSVTALFCDDVYGEWILSWNTLLSGAAFTPTFRGNWQARRVTGDGPSAERTLELMPELFELRDRLIATWQEAEMVDGVPVLPIETVSGLLQEAVAIVNELNNLSDCDVEYLGPDNVRQWIYSFTTAVSLLSGALTLAVEHVATQGFAAPAPAGPSFSSADLIRWATVLAAAGAIGPGSLDPAAATTLDQLTASVDEAIGAAGSDAERVTAAALAAQLGLGDG